jgi:predicted nucleotidyltransferase
LISFKNFVIIYYKEKQKMRWINMMKEKLQEHLDYYLSLGNNYNQVLGIFLYGSQNYGTANEESDVDCIILTIPTLENLLFSSKFSKEYKNPNTDEHIVVKDLRAYYEELAKGSPNALEILFSKYYILNEKRRISIFKF